MKKAKVFLTATALVAIVVGAYAMKARNGQASIWRCTSTGCALVNLSLTNQQEGTFTIPDHSYFKNGSNSSSCTPCTTAIAENTVVFVAN